MGSISKCEESHGIIGLKKKWMMIQEVKKLII